MENTKDKAKNTVKSAAKGIGRNKDELAKLLVEKRKALHSFRFNMAGSKNRNVKEGRNLRKDIARIMTEINVKA